METQALYGPPPPERNEQKYNSYSETQDIYGPPVDVNPNNKKADSKATLNIVNIGMVVLLFVVGLVAVINKKLSKRAKIITTIMILLAMVAATVVIQLGLRR